MEQEGAAPQAASPCPACGRHDPFAVLGVRRDRARLWLAWPTRRTFILVCLHCEAVVALPEQQFRHGRGDGEPRPLVQPAIVADAR